MPKNPETGEDLPYKGEPGYDEAKKQFPEVYAAEEGAEMAGDEGPEDAAIPEGGVVPDRDIKPLMDKIDEITDKGAEAAFGEGEEAGVVISGEIEVTVDDAVAVLAPGDGYLFDSRLPHRFRNIGDVQCIVVSACTPPSF